MTTEVTRSAAAMVMLCRRPMVCERGITPLILRIAAASDAGAAMMSDADAVRPKAHTPPTPR